jgi:hypothetical protein
MTARPFTFALLGGLLAAPAFAIDYNWTNTAGGNWNVGANWAPATVPTATDNAVIDAAGTYIVTLSDDQSINNLTLNRSTATVNHTGGIFTVGGAFAFTAGTYNLGAGSLNVTGSMTAAAGTTFNWSGGTLGGTGAITVNGTMIADTTAVKTLAGVVQVGSGGVFAVTGGEVRANSTTAGVTVLAGGVFDLRADSIVLQSDTTGFLTNAGTLRKSAGTGTILAAWAMNSTGLIDVQTGGLWLRGGGTLSGTQTGAGTLYFDLRTYTVPAGTTFNATNLSMSNSTVTTAGSGALTINGTVTVSSNGNLRPAAGGSVTINGTLLWGAGNVAGPGTTTLNGSALVTSNSGVTGVLTVGSTGSVTITGTGRVGSYTSDSGFNVLAGGLIELAADGALLVPVATFGVLNNAGTVRKSAGTGGTGIGWEVNGPGAIEVQTGTLEIKGGNRSGPHTGAGVLDLGECYLTPSSTLAIAGLRVTIGTSRIASAGATTGTLTVANSGALAVLGDLTVSGASVVSGGVIAGGKDGGTLTMNGPLTWTGGALGWTGGSTVINGAAVASTTTGKGVYGTLYIGNTGSLTVTDSLGIGAAGAGISVQAGGLFDLQSDGTVLRNNTGVLTNAGILRRSVGTGTATVAWATTNSGTIDAQAGTLAFTFAGGVTNTGTVTMSDGRTVSATGITSNSGGVIQGPTGGTGTYTAPLTFNSGSTLSPGGTGSAGRLVQTGNLTMAGGSTFHLNLNGDTVTTGFDRVEVIGTVALGGATLAGSTVGFSAGAGDRYFVLLNDGTDAISGTFNGVAQNGVTILDGYQFQVSYTGDFATNALTGGNDIVLYNFTPVPEPASVLAVSAAALACGVAAGRRWRCRTDRHPGSSQTEQNITFPMRDCRNGHPTQGGEARGGVPGRKRLEFWAE